MISADAFRGKENILTFSSVVIRLSEVHNITPLMIATPVQVYNAEYIYVLHSSSICILLTSSISVVFTIRVENSVHPDQMASSEDQMASSEAS